MRMKINNFIKSKIYFLNFITIAFISSFAFAQIENEPIGNSESQLIEEDTENNSDENIDQPNLIPLNNNDELEEDSFDFSEIESLMINQDEKQGLNLAIESYKTGEAFLFDDYEQEAVTEDKAIDIASNVEEENRNAFLHLATIIYQSKDNWTIWINDQRISASNNSDLNEIYVQDISNDYVDILWKLSLSKWKILSRNNSDDLAPNINELNQVEIKFSLKPNQTFALRNEEIIEGRVIFSSNINEPKFNAN